jgi:hypothetical protein
MTDDKDFLRRNITIVIDENSFQQKYNRDSQFVPFIIKKKMTTES